MAIDRGKPLVGMDGSELMDEYYSLLAAGFEALGKKDDAEALLDFKAADRRQRMWKGRTFDADAIRRR